MVRFFVPDADDAADAERLLAALANFHGVEAPPPGERISSIRFTREGRNYVAAVGNPVETFTYPYNPRLDRDGRLVATGHAADAPRVAAILLGEQGWLICLAGPDALPRVAVVERDAMWKVDFFEAG